LEIGGSLVANLDLLYGADGRRARIDDTLRSLRRSTSGKAWSGEVETTLAMPAEQLLVDLCGQLSNARSSLFAALPVVRRLNLLDAMQGLETEVQLAYQQLSGVQEWPRVRLLQLNRALLDCAYGSGLLSWGERASLTDALDFAGRDEIGLSEYRNAVGRLKRAPAWALGTIRHTFAEALLNYVALNERAARFGDDVLRGSPLWMLGDTLKILSLDVDRLAGSVVELAGQPVSTAVALNSGIARGRLRIFATNDEVAAAEIDRGEGRRRRCPCRCRPTAGPTGRGRGGRGRCTDTPAVPGRASGIPTCRPRAASRDSGPRAAQCPSPCNKCGSRPSR
jgi:hypothetical protein